MKYTLLSSVIVMVILLSSIGLSSLVNADVKGEVIMVDDDIVDMINQINEELVFSYHDALMSFGPRYTGSINCTLAGNYIFNEFEQMDLDVHFHDWSYRGFHSRNIIATLPGTDPSSNAIIVMSAHYDCTPGSLGADDDGSGVAAVLAAAYVMSDYSFNHTIRFIAFSGEEVGLCGSFCYARDAYENGDNIYAVINLDMVGYADTFEGGKLIRFFHPERSHWIAEYAYKVSAQYYDILDMLVEPRPNYPGADHQAFVDYGYDGVWIAHRDGYPWANSPEDTPDHMNHTYQVKATKLLLAVVAELADDPIEIQIVLKTPYEGYYYFFDTPLIKNFLGRKWYMGLRGITVIFGRAVASAEVYCNEDIEHVVFCIDDCFIYWDAEAPYEWKIQGKQMGIVGKHKLKVYAYSTSGLEATDEMDIRIFTLSCQYGKW